MGRFMISRLILLAILFSLMSTGTYGQQEACPGGDLHVKQVATGKTVGNKPEWRVVVSNDCFCVESEVKLFCRNFQSAEKVDPKVFADQGDGTCLVREDPANGDVIPPGHNVSFTYAWDTQFPFNVVSHKLSCS